MVRALLKAARIRMPFSCTGETPLIDGGPDGQQLMR